MGRIDASLMPSKWLARLVMHFDRLNRCWALMKQKNPKIENQVLKRTPNLKPQPPHPESVVADPPSAPDRADRLVLCHLRSCSCKWSEPKGGAPALCLARPGWDRPGGLGRVSRCGLGDCASRRPGAFLILGLEETRCLYARITSFLNPAPV